ncbi:MAG TPA: selenocysteine-specific translation elongation factor, partial [Gaiellaceae bacterium]|nr:selenocysteine-specific translation elongation factor [Gaiellaceae bacterium]
MPLTVGTAGHIDHGKTWLVRALTGKDTDRLPEEQARGISIDLGYAPLDLPDGRRLSLVDVPGHERFVRNMVAGATGIDLFLLVIDAGEGARPQTHEHLAILRLLGIAHGVVALTKVDAVDAEMRELAAEEARELLPGAPVVATSARTGEGLDELRAALAAEADHVERRAAEGPTRLFVDRVFTLRGIGTVATGTLWSGSIGEGDVLAVEPGGLEVRVRSVQVHDAAVERAEAGQRVAVSLPGVDRDALRRGDALVERGAYPTSYRLDVALEEMQEVRDGARLHVHHGTAEHYARVVRRGERYAQLRLTSAAAAARGDRVVLRDGTTLGGGVVLDPSPPRRTTAERSARIERGEIAATVHEPVRLEELRRLSNEVPAEIEEAGGWAFSRAWLEDLEAGLRARIAEADPLDPGVPPPAAPWATAVLPLLGLERRGAKLYLPGARASLGEREAAAAALEGRLAEAGFVPVKVEDSKLAAYLESEGRLVRLGDGYAIGADAFDRARELLLEECERSGRIALARFRDLLGTGRKQAQLLLERFDADGVTRRIGDERVLRRRATR